MQTRLAKPQSITWSVIILWLYPIVDVQMARNSLRDELADMQMM